MEVRAAPHKRAEIEKVRTFNDNDPSVPQTPIFNVCIETFGGTIDEERALSFHSIRIRRANVSRGLTGLCLIGDDTTIGIDASNVRISGAVNSGATVNRAGGDTVGACAPSTGNPCQTFGFITTRRRDGGGLAAEIVCDGSAGGGRQANNLAGLAAEATGGGTVTPFTNAPFIFTHNARVARLRGGGIGADVLDTQRVGSQCANAGGACISAGLDAKATGDSARRPRADNPVVAAFGRVGETCLNGHGRTNAHTGVNRACHGAGHNTLATSSRAIAPRAIFVRVATSDVHFTNTFGAGLLTYGVDAQSFG